MSNTSAAIKAAREVQSDTLAPELFRQANEWFFRAKNEYKVKNFKQAHEYADKARYFAEQAEFEAIRNGGTRSAELNIPDPLSNAVPGDNTANVPPPPPKREDPYEYPTPTPTPVEAYERLQQQQSQGSGGDAPK